MTKPTSDFLNMIETAKNYLGQHPEDAALAIYMVRDYQELEEFELSDLAWAFCRGGHVPASEAKWFFDLIEHHLTVSSS